MKSSYTTIRPSEEIDRFLRASSDVLRSTYQEIAVQNSTVGLQINRITDAIFRIVLVDAQIDSRSDFTTVAQPIMTAVANQVLISLGQSAQGYVLDRISYHLDYCSDAEVGLDLSDETGATESWHTDPEERFVLFSYGNAKTECVTGKIKGIGLTASNYPDDDNVRTQTDEALKSGDARYEAIDNGVLIVLNNQSVHRKGRTTAPGLRSMWNISLKTKEATR